MGRFIAYFELLKDLQQTRFAVRMTEIRDWVRNQWRIIHAAT